MDFNLQHAIDEFCGRISVARSQDDAIRQEVASHLRAKVDYYLNKRQLTEQEAFVLASQTMGDPGQFVAEMRGVHRTERITGQAFGLVSVCGLLMFIYVVQKMFSVLGSTFSSVFSKEVILYGVFQTVISLVSYVVPISVVWLFGMVIKGYGKGKPAEWVRKHASLLTSLLFVFAACLYDWLVFASYSGYAMFSEQSLLEQQTLTKTMFEMVRLYPIWFHSVNSLLPCLYLVVLAYLACWLTAFENKRVLDDFKAAFVPCVGAMLLSGRQIFFMSTESFETKVVLMNVIILGSALLCLFGGMVFRLQTRRLRVI